MTNFAAAFPGRLELNRQQAVTQQIDMAIEMFHRREWACAITLALAAETQMPDTEKPFVTSALRSEFGDDFINQLNEPRNWLKHVRDPETSFLHEMDAVIALLRAISKFTSVYRAWSEGMAAFDVWFKGEISRQGDLSNSD